MNKVKEVLSTARIRSKTRKRFQRHQDSYPGGKKKQTLSGMMVQWIKADANRLKLFFNLTTNLPNLLACSFDWSSITYFSIYKLTVIQENDRLRCPVNVHLSTMIEFLQSHSMS